MRDLTSIFIRAREKKIYGNTVEFQDMLNKIMKCNTGDRDIELDWDNGAGEEWARFIHNQKGIVCMLNAKIGVAFICRNELNNETLEVLEPLFLVDVFDYTSEIWCLDLDLLEKQVPEISWECEPHMIDVTKMSLHDLYFATV